LQREGVSSYKTVTKLINIVKRHAVSMCAKSHWYYGQAYINTGE